jgi:hypothetical protein
MSKHTNAQFKLDCIMLLCFLSFLDHWAKTNPQQFELAQLGLPFTSYSKITFRQLMNFMRIFCAYKKYESLKLQLEAETKALEEDTRLLSERANELADFAQKFQNK